ncbi:MAG: ATP-binding cassette domain-containing protein, partial [Acidobacteria bacterium]|nr:ATP-binding cassette domain-containing protein [Acidobacteriota bacterium]
GRLVYQEYEKVTDQFATYWFHLLPRLTALKNAALPLLYSFDRQHRSKREERARVILERVGLGNRVDHKPAELSGGERQRVAIARALINDPDLILADEPTGNLDSTTAVEIMELFKKLHLQGQTVIMVTHEPSIAAYAQRTIRLKDGQIINDSKNN